ncbi:hypothetical protein BOX15_Mlig023895g1 [Macrostomum lignano]|uniref:5'-3' exoribonuclease n=2 Tax=Macrostomum lignano TaxID=282301 RepID=A0A267GAR4_9PLAT|nr:hypothetical protein BOX15_Mlig023895g1 [Macrostomum lignano]
MGVPAFFRWLSRKFPSIVVHCVEEKQREVDGETVPVDTSRPNPNNYEFDNLYLDMNGIIHPCTHPEDKPAPRNEAEMFAAIFEYMDRIFAIVRPRRVIYMAIDGVAPRAKMNQQRSRRFRAAKEAREKAIELDRLRSELTAQGMTLPPPKAPEEHFDSNCITPGTPFMARLAVALRYYIHDRLHNDPGWRNLQVFLSDANVPGEGEHKIMDFIRRQRAQPAHDPNTRHCLCGADADLIMLGLATHEPHFTIIREEFVPNKPRPCDLCGQLGHEAKDCQGLARDQAAAEAPPVMASEADFIFIRLHVLREYLQRELKMDGLPFAYDFERALDDWVFMCFFVGNDFLPHLPSLEIREGAIDRLVGIYKRAVYQTGGWVTDSGHVHLDRVQLIMRELGQMEDEIFKRRRSSEMNFRRRRKADKQAKLRHTMMERGMAAPLGSGRSSGAADQQLSSGQAIRALMRESQMESLQAERDRQQQQPDSDEEADARDEVRLWEDGWRHRYYSSKFGVAPQDSRDFPLLVASHYVRGLCWVLRYYYQGCASWTWYFPYHYSPFASDFTNVASVDVDFDKTATEPFKPLEQLMAVFPAASGSHVPPSWRGLMSDPDSPIIDFYPIDFRVDLNGKKFAWMGVALLPFVDEARLLKTLESVYPSLLPDEVERNVRGPDRLFVRSTHPAAALIQRLYAAGKKAQVEDIETNADASLTSGVGGIYKPDKLAYQPGDDVPSPIALPQFKTLAQCQVASCRYSDPVFPRGHVFPARPLPGARPPPATLRPEDLEPGRQWMPNLGPGPNGGHRPRQSFDSAGPMRRMASAELGSAERFNTSRYGAVPPPQLMQQQHRMQPSGRSVPNLHHQHNQWPGQSPYPSQQQQQHYQRQFQQPPRHQFYQQQQQQQYQSPYPPQYQTDWRSGRGGGRGGGYSGGGGGRESRRYQPY